MHKALKEGDAKIIKEIINRIDGAVVPAHELQQPKTEQHLHLHDNRKIIKIVGEAEDKIKQQLKKELEEKK